MPRRYIHQLADGDSLDDVFLVSDKQVRANRQGNSFLQLELRDRSGAITGRLWNAGENVARTFEAGAFLHVRGKVQMYQGGLQVILTHINPAPAGTFDPGDFLPHTEQNLAQLQEKLRASLRRVANPHLKALADVFLLDEAFLHAFSRCPAGVRHHHAYVGGLLEHVVTLLDAAERLLPLYPDVDKDLVLLGVFLHDVGKVRELTYDRAFSYTDEGQLIGHLVIGVEMLNERLKEVEHFTNEPFPKELALRLKHMIVSHNGSYEFGSPKLPMTPEALALHLLDTFDSKVHGLTREIREDRNTTPAWTPFNPQTQRKLFKGGGGDGTPDDSNGL
jgi:3'-5' exoribonuclease